MKITKIKGHAVSIPLHTPHCTATSAMASANQIVIEVHTDEGVTGLGTIHGRMAKQVLEILDGLDTFLKGADPLAHEDVWKKVFDCTTAGVGNPEWHSNRLLYNSAHRPPLMAALGGVDIALWDIKGKVAKMSVWRLLGGKRKEVFAYVTGGYYEIGRDHFCIVDEVAEYVEQGFKGVKIKIGGYPSKPVRVITPWPAGGLTDVSGRIVFQKISENLGQQFVMENRGGATGTIGAEVVARSAPDGYTLMVNSMTHYGNPFIYKKLTYDTLNDFVPIGMMVRQTGLLVVHPSLPVKSVKELVALAKARPDQILYSSTGSGGFPDVPTVAESGFPGYEVVSWHGILAPAGVSKEIISKLNREIVAILGSPATQKLLLAEGGDITPSTPEQFSVFLKSEVTKWAKVVKQAGISAE